MPVPEGQRIDTAQWQELKRRAKIHALAQGLTLREVLVLALSQWLDRSAGKEKGK